MSANALYLKADFGAAGNGSTDDTTAFNNFLNGLGERTGKIGFIEPGVYLLPNGVVSSKQGLNIIGLGHIVNGPGLQNVGSGVVLKSTGASATTLTVDPGTNETNEYYGWHIENITFAVEGGTDPTCLHLKNSYSAVLRCGFVNTGSADVGTGLRIMHDGGAADSAQLNKITDCEAKRLLRAYVIGASGMTGGVQTQLVNCNSLGSFAGNTGTAVEMWDNGSGIIGGKYEGHARGIDVRSISGNCSIIGARFEGNATYDVDLRRASGTGSGTNNVVVMGNYGTVHIGADQVAEFIIGPCTITDDSAGVGAHTVFGSDQASIRVWDRAASGSITSGGVNGEIRMADTGRIYFKQGGAWYFVIGTAA